jgi:MFS family permease
MSSRSRVIRFINIGHLVDHLAMLIFPTAVLGMQSDFSEPFGKLIALAFGGFAAFGAGSLPAGWLGDRWSRRHMLAVFFLGIGAALIATGFAETRWQLAGGLAAVGLFAAIYHPVGTAMLVAHAERMGREIGVNGVWGNLGVAFAAIATGAVTEWLGWRWAFMLPGSAALGIGGAYLALVPAEANRAGHSDACNMAIPRDVLIRAFVVLSIVTASGGLMFNATTVALPKLFEERIPQLGGSTFEIGILVCAVYLVGALSQLVVGRLVDRRPLKLGLLAVAVLQAPLLLATARSTGWSIVVVLAVTISMIFGQITFNDAMIARYAAAGWRSRIYALRYFCSFAAAAAAVPLVALVQARGGFTLLFEMLAVFGGLVLAGAVFFPYRPEEIAGPAPAEAIRAAE